MAANPHTGRRLSMSLDQWQLDAIEGRARAHDLSVLDWIMRMVKLDTYESDCREIEVLDALYSKKSK